MSALDHTAPIEVQIALGERSYPILIGAGLLSQASAWQGLPKASTALIVPEILNPAINSSFEIGVTR